MAKKSKVVKKNKVIEFVSKKDFDAFKDVILKALNTPVAPPIPQEITNGGSSEEELPRVVSEVSIPPEHDEVFTKYFDRADGFDAKLDLIENTFTIVVPPKFSNSSNAHKEYYPVDKRLIKLDSNNPLGTVEEWCQRVAKNLKYDKNIKTK